MTCICSTIILNFFAKYVFSECENCIKKSFRCLYSSGSRLQSLTQGKIKTITMTGNRLFLLEAENRTLEQWGVLYSKVVFYSGCKCKQTNEKVKYKKK